jgi:hypothetical protein
VTKARKLFHKIKAILDSVKGPQEMAIYDNFKIIQRGGKRNNQRVNKVMHGQPFKVNFSHIFIHSCHETSNNSFIHPLQSLLQSPGHWPAGTVSCHSQSLIDWVNQNVCE